MPQRLDVQRLRATAARLRTNIVKMIAVAGSGHNGGALSAADVITYLYFHQMRIDPADPRWPDRDRFVMSKGHCCPALYAALAERGYFSEDVLWTLRDIGSPLQGHPDMTKTPGIDMTTGSLGQGISSAVGIALGGKLDRKDYRVYCMIGDGELQEGQVWEAAMAAAHYRLDNLTVIVDNNKLETDGRFAKRFPDRFFNMGAAEQNMIGVAAGLATTGKLPFASTFAVFASLRASEQIRTSVAYPKLNVKIVATTAGVEICGDGATHQAIEDLAVMRAIPNMLVVSPSDPVTTRKAVLAIADHMGPVYMRLGRQEAAVLHDEETPFTLGKMTHLRQGRDLTIIAAGHMVEQALLAADVLAAQGVAARVLDCHTIKPIDEAAIVAAAAETGGIVTAEDHSVIGGLGSAVCELVSRERPTRVHRVGLADCFASSGRDYRRLMAHYRLDAQEIVRQAMALLEKRTTWTTETNA